MKKIIVALMFSSLLIIGALGARKILALSIIPFGGQIEQVQFCCNGGVLLQVGPPRSGLFLFQSGVSRLYAYWQIYRTGAWVLGTANPGGVCATAASECE